MIDWTPERKARFEQLWLEGHPFSEMSETLAEEWGLDEITKNTLIGKAHREGWERRPNTKSNHFIPQRNFFEGNGVGCLWPDGHPDDPQFHFCGAHPLPGKPYCAAHAALAYIRPKDDIEKLAA